MNWWVYNCNGYDKNELPKILGATLTGMRTMIQGGRSSIILSGKGDCQSLVSASKGFQGQETQRVSDVDELEIKQHDRADMV